MKVKYFLFLSALALTLGLAANADTDTTAPSAITNLAVATTTASLATLTWNAPGDDLTVGTSTSYDLRYATSSISDSTWTSLTQATGESAPKIAGSSETMTVSGLSSSTLYYFAIKSKDEAGNESNLSNVANGTTLAPPAPTPLPGTTVEMDVTPPTLNLASQGQWVSVHLSFPAGCSASAVDLASIKLNGTLSADSNFKGVDKFEKGKSDKGKSFSNLILKFSRAGLINLVGAASGAFNVTITGSINSSTCAIKNFSASDKVNILSIAPEPDNTLVQATSSPDVFIIINGHKRHIPSPRAFARLGFKWQNIKKISQAELDSYLDDELLRASNSPDVFIIVGGLKRHIPSPEVFNSYGFDWNNISVVSPQDLADYLDATLIRAAGDSKVYLLVGGKKHWISSLDVFNKHGYNWDLVIIINSTEKDAIGEGEPVS
jgi:hypothetical protein